MTQNNRYEQQFLDALKDIFIGAKVEGNSGYINLMCIKSRYFSEGVFPQLMKDINVACKPFDQSFREELFDKLYDFFKRYFSENGSIYFRHTPQHDNIYEKVYTDERDVMLFWKTHMLYYVKTDRLFNSMDVDIDGTLFYFDASKMELKRSNEKRELLYNFEDYKAGKVVLSVAYSEKGRKTKTDDILRALKAKAIVIDEDVLLRACRVFEKQSEVDYFINKNAKAFLKEQFDLWMYQYIFSAQSDFDEKRLKQLQAIKRIANNIIDFIAQFEDELVRIWNKPKFVLNSHYVITLDKITSADLRKKIFAHSGIKAQIQEWQDMGMVGKDFNTSVMTKQHRFLPIDTHYFPDLELEILALFDDLDTVLDGWLIHSENYQGLLTILPKFKEQIQTVYIDPPFNKEQDADYHYSVKYKDSSWITILENRLLLAKSLLSDTGSIYVKCDYNGSMYVRLLMNELFSPDKFRSEIIWKRFTGTKIQRQHLAIVTDTIYCFTKTDNYIYKQQYAPYREEYIKTFFNNEDEYGKYCTRNFYSEGDGPPRDFFGKSIPPPAGHHWRYKQANIDDLIQKGRIVLDKNGFPKLKMYLNEMKGDPYDNLIDETHVVQGSSKESCDFATQNPEKLLHLLLESSANSKDIVLDFYLGSGTTASTAHKTNKKWIGIELGEHFNTIVLPRMKRVLAGDDAGISKAVDWKGGGFFKYYDLEQYEDTLRNASYQDSDMFTIADAYNNYVFMRDLKMLDAISLDKVKNKIYVHLEKLYPGIDLAETLSCITGKGIKRITKETVEFQDGTSSSLVNPDWELIKPLVWW